MIASISALAVSLVFAAVVYARLQDVKIRGWKAFGIAAVIVFQGILAIEHGALFADVLALLVFGLASDAINYLRVESVRSVIAVGVYLAILQLLDPLWIVVTVVVSIYLMFVRRPRLAWLHHAGTLTLLFFLPLLAFLMAIYVRRKFGFEADWWAVASGLAVSNREVFGTPLVTFLLLTLAGTPIWFFLKARSSLFIGVSAVSAGAVVVVATFAAVKIENSFWMFSASICGLAVVAFEQSLRERTRPVAVLNNSLSSTLQTASVGAAP